MISEIHSAIDSRIMQAYGYITNNLHTPCHNTYKQFLKVPTWYYFNRPMYTAFHNFNPLNTYPNNIKILLQLGQKFYPTPEYSTSTKIIKQSLKRFVRDQHMETFLAGNVLKEEERFSMCYRLGSKWKAPTWQ